MSSWEMLHCLVGDGSGQGNLSSGGKARRRTGYRGDYKIGCGVEGNNRDNEEYSNKDTF